MSEPIKKTYKKGQKLSLISSAGAGIPVLIYIKQLQKIFSPGFLSTPDPDDIDNWNNNNRTIKWYIDDDKAELIETIDEKTIGLLQNEEKKLLEQIEKLKIEIDKEEKGYLDKQQALRIIDHFSFNWKNPDQKVYRTKNGITIVDWGLCDADGNIIPPTPPPTPPIVEPKEELGESEDQEDITKDNADPWWKRKKLWLFVLLALLMAFLLKNCKPHAEISLSDQSPRLLWKKGGEILQWDKSHDSTSIFSKGLLKETPTNELTPEWVYYMWDVQNSSFNLLNKIPSKTVGLYLVKLKITDDGNKLNFWKRSDIDDLLITVFIDTTIQRQIPEINKIPFDSNTVPIPKEYREPFYADGDKDKTPDIIDRFPKDPNAANDRDGDLVPDPIDKFPDDYYEQEDKNGNGLGDNGDPYFTDPTDPDFIPVPPIQKPSKDTGDNGKKGGGSGDTGDNGKKGNDSGGSDSGSNGKKGEVSGGSGDNGKKGGGSKPSGSVNEVEWYPEKITEKHYENGWILHVKRKKQRKEDEWNTTEIWYEDPNGKKIDYDDFHQQSKIKKPIDEDSKRIL